jgi:integrase
MSDPSTPYASRRRRQGAPVGGRSSRHQPVRRQEWAGLSTGEILARQKPGTAPPLRVLEILLTLFNAQHTALEKTVSHKTRHERAMFLRRFFRDLRTKGGFKTLPDPRNLGHRHIQAMVDVWRREHLAPATIQTYLSFLRGLAMWLGKHGFVRGPAHYGLEIDEYRRHEVALRDKSWSAQGIDIEDMLTRIARYDRHVGAQLRLILALGLRRKEAVMFRPFASNLSFDETGLPEEERQADRYVRIKAGSKGGRERFVPLNCPERHAAMALAETVAVHKDGHLGDPAKTLQQNLRRFSYVLARFGLKFRELGATGHGLRHEMLNNAYQGASGYLSPVRGGGPVPPDIDHAARLHVAKLAGHGRAKASGAYLGALLGKRRRPSAPAGDPSGGSSPDPAENAPPDVPLV